MARQATLFAEPFPGTPDRGASRLRDQSLVDHLEEHRPGISPAAARLTAEIHEAARDALRGSITALAGHRTGPRWRKVVSVDGCDLAVADLAHFATTPTPATRAAVRAAVVALLAAAEPQHAPAGSVTSRAAEAVVAVGELNREAAEDLSDGFVDDDEMRRLVATTVRVQQELDAVLALARGSRR